MNKKEISEIKKQFTPENCSITRICGCYVDGEKNKKTELKEAFLSLSEEEMFKYFEIFRKSLSGTIGKNLMNMEFPLEQEAEGGTGEADIFSDKNETVEEDFQSDAAGTATPAADATVHMTISVAGVLADAKDGTAMAQRDVTVKDLNSDGILTYDEALSAAHDEYYEGGAAAGYASADSQYGLSLTKLWGDTSGYFGYWDNDRSCNNLSDEVKADDYLTAFVYKDQSAWSDSYTRFVQKEYQATVGKAVTVSVEKASYDENYNTVFAAYDAAGLTAYDSEYKPLAADAYSVDGSNVTFNQAGTYYLATAGTDSVNLVPAVAKVTVEAWKAPFSNIRLYASETAYKNGEEPIAYTPA